MSLKRVKDGLLWTVSDAPAVQALDSLLRISDERDELALNPPLEH